jgi:cobalamin biosynthesis Mg chelatase CobN
MSAVSVFIGMQFFRRLSPAALLLLMVIPGAVLLTTIHSSAEVTATNTNAVIPASGEAASDGDADSSTTGTNLNSRASEDAATQRIREYFTSPAVTGETRQMSGVSAVSPLVLFAAAAIFTILTLGALWVLRKRYH